MGLSVMLLRHHNLLAFRSPLRWAIRVMRRRVCNLSPLSRYIACKGQLYLLKPDLETTVIYREVIVVL